MRQAALKPRRLLLLGAVVVAAATALCSAAARRSVRAPSVGASTLPSSGTHLPGHTASAAATRGDAGGPASPAPAQTQGSAPGPTNSGSEAGGGTSVGASREAPPALRALFPKVSPEQHRYADAMSRSLQVADQAVMRCFPPAEAGQPGHQEVTLRFTVVGQGLSGHFKDGEVLESTYANPYVNQCFLEALSTALFPAPPEGETREVTVTVTNQTGR